MATADKSDHNTGALERGEKVTGSVTGITDTPSRDPVPDNGPHTSGGGGGRTTSTPSTTPSTSTPSTSTPSTSTPSTTPGTKRNTTTSTGPAKAEPPASATNVDVSPTYQEGLAKGFLGETPDPNSHTVIYPAHGDGDLRTGSNDAAKPLARDTTAPDATAEASGIAGVAPGLDPANEEQWGNGPAK